MGQTMLIRKELASALQSPLGERGDDDTSATSCAKKKEKGAKT